MAMLVGQLIEILEQFDQDREVMIHTLSGQPTHEIYLAKDDTLLYSNGDK